MSRPVVGVTGPDRGGLAAWLFTAWAVWRAGGRPLRIRPRAPRPIEALDALIVGGGADVAPSLYGERPRLGPRPARRRDGLTAALRALVSPAVALVRWALSTKKPRRDDPARDALESGLLRDALDRGMPVLGICRGAQLLNVVCGGTLHQELSAFYVESPNVYSVRPAKSVTIRPESRLARVLGRARARVNSLHRQAINEPGEGLAPVAFEDNCVVQAIEHVEAPCVLGVQWHPEYMPQRPEQRRLFQHVIRAARG